jgi:hypothetical protein
VTRGAQAVPFVFFLVVWTLTTHGKFSDSGDEPHYLMVAESLLSDGDLDVANNYRDRDGRWFGADTLEAGPHARVTPAGRTWSTHDVGVPVLILPVYALATRAAVFVPNEVLRVIRQPRGLLAYSLISLSLMALTASGVWLLVVAMMRRAPTDVAAIVALVAAVSPPVLSHAFLVFPETMAFFVVCAVAWLFCVRSDEVTVRRVALVVAAIGLLPWLHRKYSFFVLGLMFLLVHRHWRAVRAQPPRVRWGLAALALGPQAALHAWTFYVWGNVGGPQMIDTLPFSFAGIARGALGLLLDRERGLLGYAPIYLLLPVCWILGWREHRTLLVPVLLLFAPMATFAVWSAGFSPAARYLVPLVPLLVLPAARAIAFPVVRWAALPILALQTAVTAVVWHRPRALWPKEQGTNEALASIPWVGPAYERFLPSMFTGDSIVAALVPLTCIAIGAASVAFVARRVGPK